MIRADALGHVLPGSVTTPFWLLTGARCERNIRPYQRAGYVLTDREPGLRGAVFLTKPRP